MNSVTLITWHALVPGSLPLFTCLVKKLRHELCLLFPCVLICCLPLNYLSMLRCLTKLNVWVANVCKDWTFATLSPRKNYRKHKSANNQMPNNTIMELLHNKTKQPNRRSKSSISTFHTSLLVCDFTQQSCKLEGNILNHTGRLPNFHRALATNWCRLIKEQRNL